MRLETPILQFVHLVERVAGELVESLGLRPLDRPSFDTMGAELALCELAQGVGTIQEPDAIEPFAAERDRLGYSNARVSYGDRESFPGKGKGKWKNADARWDDRVWDDDEDSDRAKGKSTTAKARAKDAKKRRG